MTSHGGQQQHQAMVGNRMCMSRLRVSPRAFTLPPGPNPSLISGFRRSYNHLLGRSGLLLGPSALVKPATQASGSLPQRTDTSPHLPCPYLPYILYDIYVDSNALPNACKASGLLRRLLPARSRYLSPFSERTSTTSSSEKPSSSLSSVS